MNLSIVMWIFLISIFSIAALFLPRVGILTVIGSSRDALDREHIEDALKHLLERTWERRPASSDTLKANLGLGDHQILLLVDRMISQGLLKTEGSDLALSPEGERLAIQITRAHRLLERYLADEARMPLDQIHKEAHRREHQVSSTEVDELDAFLGYPANDPHGDPIPNRNGAFLQKETKPLTSFSPEEIGFVAHIEDEPAIAFAQVIAEGIHLGQTLRVVESAPDRVILTDGENEFRLAPVVAANVHLQQVESLIKQSDLVSLNKLENRQEGEIITLDKACQGFTRRRFLDLGLTPGTVIYPELNNPFGEPRAYRVRGTLIALRKDQADQILVRPIPPGAK